MAAAPAPVYLGDQVDVPPSDGTSRLRFSDTSDVLLVSSWDKTLRLYDAVQKLLRVTVSMQAPLLDCCFQDDYNAFTAGLDGQVKMVNLQTRSETVIGTHQKGVQSVEYLKERGLLVSGSWDQTLKLWDPRAPAYQNCIAVVSLPGKVYSMSSARDRLVVGASGRHVAIFDVRRLESGQPEQVRESSLKFQTRCVSAYPDGHGYALSSVEGRVAMEYYDMSPEAQANKYAFKCHRRNENGRDVVYPVHCIAFHPGYGTFATGGGDGLVNIWDGANKKRLFQTARYPTSVASLAFSRTGALLAVAASYVYEQGERDHPPDAIYVREVQDVEVRPKQKK